MWKTTGGARRGINLTVNNILQKIKYLQFNSLQARKILGLFYKEGRIYSIPFGPLRGLKIRYHKDINFHVMLGLWEMQNSAALARIIGKTDFFKGKPVVVDVGANCGTYSLWFHRHFPRDSTIYAFEPAAPVIKYLKENISLNHAGNIQVIEGACTERSGKTNFYVGFHHHVSSLNWDCAYSLKTEPKLVEVDAIALDDFFYGSEKRQAPDLIKIDVEGAGELVLKGASRCIRENNPLILIESHIPQEDRAISRCLLDNGYQAFRITNRKWVEDLTSIHPDPKGVWGTLLLCPGKLFKPLKKIFP